MGTEDVIGRELEINFMICHKNQSSRKIYNLKITHKNKERYCRVKLDFFNPSPIFCAPFLGNGQISLQIGPAGSMNNVGGGKLIESNPSRAI